MSEDDVSRRSDFPFKKQSIFTDMQESQSSEQVIIEEEKEESEYSQATESL